MFNPTYFPRQRWTYPKDHERNFVAAFFHMISITLLFTSCVQLSWFRVYSGTHCTSYLSLHQFFTIGYFDLGPSESSIKFPTGEVISTPVTLNYHSASGVLYCITPQVVNLIRTVILLCIAAICSSVVGFCLDVIGPKKKLLSVIRKNGIPSIITVLLIVAAIGLCYLTTRALEFAVFNAYPRAVIQVSFEYGCYTIAIAGSVSILAAACNLLQPISPPEDVQRHRLVDDWDGLETFSSVGMRNMPPPPPPYSP